MCIRDSLSIHNDVSTTKHNKYVSIPGILRKEAIMLLRYFYVRENEKAPKPRTKKDRKLDKDTFPLIDWKRYLTFKEFVSEFGEQHSMKYELNQDVYDTIDWELIDASYGDQFLDELKRQIHSQQTIEIIISN